MSAPDLRRMYELGTPEERAMAVRMMEMRRAYAAQRAQQKRETKREYRRRTSIPVEERILSVLGEQGPSKPRGLLYAVSTGIVRLKATLQELSEAGRVEQLADGRWQVRT